jgi:hypothetical protein
VIRSVVRTAVENSPTAKNLRCLDVTSGRPRRDLQSRPALVDELEAHGKLFEVADLSRRRAGASEADLALCRVRLEDLRTLERGSAGGVGVILGRVADRDGLLRRRGERPRRAASGPATADTRVKSCKPLAVALANC